MPPEQLVATIGEVRIAQINPVRLIHRPHRSSCPASSTYVQGSSSRLIGIKRILPSAGRSVTSLKCSPIFYLSCAGIDGAPTPEKFVSRSQHAGRRTVSAVSMGREWSEKEPSKRPRVVSAVTSPAIGLRNCTVQLAQNGPPHHARPSSPIPFCKQNLEQDRALNLITIQIQKGCDRIYLLHLGLFLMRTLTRAVYRV